MENQKHYATEEQRIYAALLDRGMKIGFVLLVISFALYLTGVIEPHVPVRDLPAYWGMSAVEYAQAAEVPPGWGWLSLAGTGDYMNFIGIAVLAFVTVACYLRILPILVRNGDTAFGVIVVLEVLVLLLAASGLLVVGH